MTKDPNLNDFFAAAHDDRPQPSASFLSDMARQAVAHTPQAANPVSQGWSLFGVLGGWPAGAGMALATLCGVAFGINLSDQMLDLTVAALDADLWDGSGYVSYEYLFDEGTVQ